MSPATSQVVASIANSNTNTNTNTNQQQQQQQTNNNNSTTIKQPTTIQTNMHQNMHVCQICDKLLSSSSSLDRHMLTHSGERPFVCKRCQMTFTTNGKYLGLLNLRAAEIFC